MSKGFWLNFFILLVAGGLGYLVAYSFQANLLALENQRQNLLQELEKEKTALNRLKAENRGLKSYLKSAHKRLRKSFMALDRREDELGRLGAQLSVLRAENSTLFAEREKKVRIAVTPVPASGKE
ncbi:MAG: hypothetical protein WC478_02250 [Candidatus Omnitrophota bacterium]